MPNGELNQRPASEPPSPAVLKLQSSLLCSFASDPRKRNGRRCVCDTLTRCRTTWSSVPFDSCWMWITRIGLPYVELLLPRTRHTGDTPGFRSTMSQGRRILRSSMVRSIPTPMVCFKLNPCMGTWDAAGNLPSLVGFEAGKLENHYLATYGSIVRWKGPLGVREFLKKKPHIHSSPIGVLTGDRTSGRKTVCGSPTPRLFSMSSTLVSYGSKVSPIAS